MSTTTNPTDANETFALLDNAGGWRTASELEAEEATLHWLTDKLWAERKHLGNDPETGADLWAFRAR